MHGFIVLPLLKWQEPLEPKESFTTVTLELVILDTSILQDFTTRNPQLQRYNPLYARSPSIIDILYYWYWLLMYSSNYLLKEIGCSLYEIVFLIKIILYNFTDISYHLFYFWGALYWSTHRTKLLQQINVPEFTNIVSLDYTNLPMKFGNSNYCHNKLRSTRYY